MYMYFDYFSCIQHSVIVDEKNSAEHLVCDKVGEFFVVKNNKKKVLPGIISLRVVNAAKEKINIEKFKQKKIEAKHKKVLAQERFEKQIPEGAMIVNLLEMKC